MAKVVGPLGSMEARGHVGGLVYGSWRGLSTVRARVDPINQFTDPRVAARSVSGYLTAFWQALDPSQRAAWNELAARSTRPDWTGQRKRWSGYNLFMWLNWLPYDYATNHVTNPPAHLWESHMSPLTIYQDGIDLSINWTHDSQYWFDELAVDLRISGPISVGRRPDFHQAKHFTYAIYSEDFAIYSPVSPGLYAVWARVFHYVSGQPSPWQSGEQICVQA